MRANPYKWIGQSPSHRQYARRNYPVMAGVAERTNGYESFAFMVKNLPEHLRDQYVVEWNDWRINHGEAWDRLGCIRETRIGQYTSRYRRIGRRS